MRNTAYTGNFSDTVYIFRAKKLQECIQLLIMRHIRHTGNLSDTPCIFGAKPSISLAVAEVLPLFEFFIAQYAANGIIQLHIGKDDRATFSQNHHDHDSHGLGYLEIPPLLSMLSELEPKLQS